MKRQFGPSLYFASDKVIFDALNHIKVTTDVIRELLFDRGIIVSSKTSKYELAQYFSRLTADYFDHHDIAVKLGRPQARGRITYAEISELITQNEIIEAAQTAKVELEQQGNLVTIQIEKGRVLIKLDYDHIDYTQVEFRQIQHRDGVIEFLKDVTGKYVIRSSQDHEIDKVVDKLFTEINLNREIPVRQERISLEGIPNPVLRCKFFNELVNGINGHQFITVTEAYCYKPNQKNISENDADDESSQETSLEDQPNVERVSLKGTGVTRSFVIDDLYAKGYYIVKAIWRVKPESSLDSDIYEIEAQFTEPQSCTNFSYQVRNAIIFEDGKLTDKKRLPKLAEQDALFRLIEAAAKLAYEALE
ncbi:MAG: hypothetical protein H7240_06930 [Glaciimonas sp.]|nr:hypothetical protein [Glaciimonas sp.]